MHMQHARMQDLARIVSRMQIASVKARPHADRERKGAAAP